MPRLRELRNRPVGSPLIGRRRIQLSFFSWAIFFVSSIIAHELFSFGIHIQQSSFGRRCEQRRDLVSTRLRNHSQDDCECNSGRNRGCELKSGTYSYSINVQVFVRYDAIIIAVFISALYTDRRISHRDRFRSKWRRRRWLGPFEVCKRIKCFSIVTFKS